MNIFAGGPPHLKGIKKIWPTIFAIIIYLQLSSILLAFGVVAAALLIYSLKKLYALSVDEKWWCFKI